MFLPFRLPAGDLSIGKSFFMGLDDEILQVVFYVIKYFLGDSAFF